MRIYCNFRAQIHLRVSSSHQKSAAAFWVASTLAPIEEGFMLSANLQQSSFIIGMYASWRARRKRPSFTADREGYFALFPK